MRRGLDGIREDTAHRFRRLPLGLGGDMGVGVQSEVYKVVAQHPGYRLDIHAVLERQGREGVPEVVETDLRQSRLFQYPV